MYNYNKDAGIGGYIGQCIYNILLAEMEKMMAMFSFDKSSCESRLVELLQNKFFDIARRNKIIAKWAGGRLGYRGNDLNKYVRKIILEYLLVPNDRVMIEKILLDFEKENIPMTEDIILKKIKSVEIRIGNQSRVEKNAS